MPIAWYITKYNRREGRRRPIRYCAMDDYSQQIHQYGGQWAESEGLDGAVVKVRSRPVVLDFLNEQPGFYRLPRERLNDDLGGLSTSVISHLRDLLLTAGYTIDEVHNEFGDGLENHTLRDYLHFWTQRRLKPRYNPANDTIVLDGPVQECRSIESVDQEVADTAEEAYERARKARARFNASMGLPFDLAQAIEQDIKQELEQNAEALSPLAKAKATAWRALRPDMPVETQRQLLKKLHQIAKDFDDLVFGSIDEEVSNED